MRRGKLTFTQIDGAEAVANERVRPPDVPRDNKLLPAGEFTVVMVAVAVVSLSP